MKEQFNDNADFFNPEARIVNLPAHKVREIDFWSIREDASRLKGWTTEQVYAEYGTIYDVPAQAYAFISWKKAERDLPDETKELLKQAMAEDDTHTPEPLKGRIVLSPVLRFRRRG